MLRGRKDARLNGQRIPLTKYLESRATLVSENICKHERIDIQSHDRPRKLTAELLGFQREFHCLQRILCNAAVEISGQTVAFDFRRTRIPLLLAAFYPRNRITRSTYGRCPRRIIVRVK